MPTAKRINIYGIQSTMFTLPLTILINRLITISTSATAANIIVTAISVFVAAYSNFSNISDLVTISINNTPTIHIVVINSAYFENITLKYSPS